MIDIHCHILPAVDDGVRTMDEALDLIRMEASGGTKGFIATPHVIEERDLRVVHEMAAHTEHLREAVKAEGIEVAIHQGGEIYPSLKMIKALDEGKPLTLAGQGKHMLVDLPLTTLPSDFDTFLFEVQSRGVTPILAHPERAGSFQRSPDSLSGYLDRGVACQVNASSLRGRYGPGAQELALYILKKRWAQFLASDAHRPGRRPILGTAVASLVDELGTTYLELLTGESARCVLTGSDLPPRLPTPPEPPPKGWFARWFSRRAT